MTNKNELRRLLQDKFQVKQDKLTPIPGTLGNGLGTVKVPNRPHYVYVRVSDKVEEIFCNRVPYENDLLVLVGFDPLQPEIYQVLSTRSTAPMGTTGGAVTGYPPARRFQWMARDGGQDPLWVEQRQLMPLRIGVYAGLLIQVYRGFVFDGTYFRFVDSQLFDLSSFIPSTVDASAYVLISVNISGVVVGTKGIEVASGYPGLEYIPDPPAGSISVQGAVRVYYGQTVVRENRSVTDIVDLRGSYAGGQHNPVTVTDTATVDLTLTGQALSAAVLPGGIKLDDFATPDDNTDLDATTGHHGLLPKLGGGTTNYLRADGSWAAPAGGGGGSVPAAFNVYLALNFR